MVAEHPTVAARPSWRLLPRGRADLLRQIAIWLGFGLGYEVARALADRGTAEALRNADRVVSVEQHLGGLFELDFQRWALDGGHVFLQCVNWTYWLSQFVVLSTGLLWVYLRRNDAYLRLRNTLIAVNLVGLVGYVALPTAPPRLLHPRGFVDTLQRSPMNFHSRIVELLANPHAAMPSLHAADALVLAVVVVPLVRPRVLGVLVLCWPPWVWFCLLATGNHFWLDVAVGAAIGTLGLVATPLLARRRGR